MFGPYRCNIGLSSCRASSSKRLKIIRTRLYSTSHVVLSPIDSCLAASGQRFTAYWYSSSSDAATGTPRYCVKPVPSKHSIYKMRCKLPPKDRKIPDGIDRRSASMALTQLLNLSRRTCTASLDRLFVSNP